MAPVTFGYVGNWNPSFPAVQQAASLVKSDPTPVGVEVYPATVPSYRVATNREYFQAAQVGRLLWTA